MKTTLDILSKYQRVLLGVAIFLALLAVSVTVDKQGVNLNLINYPAMMILLVAAGIVLAIIYIKIDKNRIDNLSRQIESLSNEGVNGKSKLAELTTRQREVYDLIITGKSNKEIMASLFIEQSTLKSHINQIYKKLNIKSRRELKSSANT